MIRRPPRSTRTDTLFPYTTSSDLLTVGDVAQGLENRPGSGRVGFPPDGGVGLLCMVAKGATAKRDEGRMGGSRSEEHTPELQSLLRITYDVFCLKKKKNYKLKTLSSYIHTQTTQHK